MTTGISETDKAWTAGIVDGEGCIRTRTIRYGKSNECVTCDVSVNNTDYRMLKKLFNLWGGRITHRTKIGYRQQWVWELHERNSIMHFLDSIEPYLVIKKEQAGVGFLLAETVRGPAAGRKGPFRVSEAIRVLRRCLRDQLAGLKRMPCGDV